jgi:hypothetical protein
MRAQAQFDQSEVIMDTCFLCNKAIESEDDYILIGLVHDEVAELVPAHQDCANLGSDHVEPFGLLESPPFGMASS